MMEPTKAPVYFTILIPAHNEEGSIRHTCESILLKMAAEQIADYEIVIVNDGSRDGTEAELRRLTEESKFIRYVNNETQNGFGNAIRYGLKHCRGEAICIVMADLSDAPDDIVCYYRKMREGWDCVFGSRFMKGGAVYDYPHLKYIINRFANWFIKIIFGIAHDDITNAFKCYRREVIDGIQPLLSKHFNLTGEMPLKAIVRGYSYCRVPISWRNRTSGVSKLKIKEMGSRYLFIVLYVWLEKLLSRGDYRKPATPDSR